MDWFVTVFAQILWLLLLLSGCSHDDSPASRDRDAGVSDELPASSDSSTLPDRDSEETTDIETESASFGDSDTDTATGTGFDTDSSGSSDTGTGTEVDSTEHGSDGTDGVDTVDSDSETAPDTETVSDTETLESCHFDYETIFPDVALLPRLVAGAGDFSSAAFEPPPGRPVLEPPAPFTYRARSDDGSEVLVMPGYEDAMPVFERSEAFGENETRCFELPSGVRDLTEAEAYDLYREVAEQTTGIALDTTPRVRSVVGIRGAYPGTFAWNGNAPNYFNDTLVLLFVDDSGKKRVREFPVHTDTGTHYFGVDSSSSLLANRRYHYVDGWHGATPYNALQIDDVGYRVRNDTNANGHFDDDRNGWLPPDGDDYFRTGSGHNIHMASVDGPLGEATVDEWSAGCQVIPGAANWERFIRNAWSGEGKEVSYFLVDARDIPRSLWFPCSVEDGSHACPIHLTLPAEVDGDTVVAGEAVFDRYNCSNADESGAELVYVLTVDEVGILNATVTCEEPVDIDIHLLSGDDENACLTRGHRELSYDITPGRYLITADSFVDGTALAGPFTLSVRLE